MLVVDTICKDLGKGIDCLHRVRPHRRGKYASIHNIKVFRVPYVLITGDDAIVWTRSHFVRSLHVS
jgi:hypothetical protein